MFNPDRMTDAKISFSAALLISLALTILPQTEVLIPSGIGIGLWAVASFGFLYAFSRAARA